MKNTLIVIGILFLFIIGIVLISAGTAIPIVNKIVDEKITKALEQVNANHSFFVTAMNNALDLESCELEYLRDGKTEKSTIVWSNKLEYTSDFMKNYCLNYQSNCGFCKKYIK